MDCHNYLHRFVFIAILVWYLQVKMHGIHALLEVSWKSFQALQTFCLSCRTGGNRHQVKNHEIRCGHNTFFFFFYCRGGQRLAQDAQIGCGVFICIDIEPNWTWFWLSRDKISRGPTSRGQLFCDSVNIFLSISGYLQYLIVFIDLPVSKSCLP